MTTLTDCMRGNRRRGREEWPTVSVESEWSDAYHTCSYVTIVTNIIAMCQWSSTKGCAISLTTIIKQVVSQLSVAQFCSSWDHSNRHPTFYKSHIYFLMYVLTLKDPSSVRAQNYCLKTEKKVNNNFCLILLS
jgi:hypothetical protein